MKYLVEITPSVEGADRIDAAGGPGALFAYIGDRFHPEAVYGVPTRRQVFLIVDLETEADTAELMYLLTWGGAADPVFRPIFPVQEYGDALERAMKGPVAPAA